MRVARKGVEGVIRCECAKVARTDRLLEAANIPFRYARCELENFDVMPSPDRSIEKAKIAAEKFVDEYPMPRVSFGLLFMARRESGKPILRWE